MVWELWSGLTTLDMKAFGSTTLLQVKESLYTLMEMFMMVSG